jgi:hypothetical protein
MPRVITNEEWAEILKKRKGFNFNDFNDNTIFVSSANVRIESEKEVADPRDNDVRLVATIDMTVGDVDYTGIRERITVEVDIDNQVLKPLNPKVQKRYGAAFKPYNMDEFVESILSLS